MIREIKIGVTIEGKQYKEFAGLSTDTFDEDGASGSEWKKIAALGGSGA